MVSGVGDVAGGCGEVRMLGCCLRWGRVVGQKLVLLVGLGCLDEVRVGTA